MGAPPLPPAKPLLQPGATQASPPVQPVTAQAIPSGAGTPKPTLDVLTALRDRLGRIWTTVTGEVRTFTGKTISEIVAEVDKIGADLESKL